MSWNARGKSVIVTGAGSAIDHAFAEQLLKAGCSVIIFADVALRPEAEATSAQFPHSPKNGSVASALYHQTGQSNWFQSSETWEFALKTFGRGAAAVHFWELPGVSPWIKDDPSSTAGVYKIFSLKVMGPSAYLSMVGTPLYSSTKSVLCCFAQSFAQFKARLGIRVSVMYPVCRLLQAGHAANYCKSKIRNSDMNMTMAECAHDFGNGEIVEATQFGKDKSDVRVRKVPFHRLLLTVDFSGDFSAKNIMAQEKLYAKLKTSGMRQ